MDKRFLGILVGIIVIFAGIFVVAQHNSNNNSGATTNNAQPTNHVEGLGQKGVTLVEYGDYECPVCADYYPIVKQVAAQFNDQIYFQFRNLPLSTIHPNAFAAARAAEAAGLQNKYFQMHDTLYANQNNWVGQADPKSTFDTYAKNLGLNVSQFDSDYASSKVNDSINADLSTFLKTNQQEATPTFFLDGKFVDNSQFVDSKTGQLSVDKFATLINAEIASKTRQ